MLTATVDFNALSNGLVRGLADAVTGDGELREGALVLLRDGEGSEAFGALRELRDNLIFAAVDWDTWSPEGTTTMLPLPVPERGNENMLIVTGSVWQAGTSGELAARVEKLAERPLVLA